MHRHGAALAACLWFVVAPAVRAEPVALTYDDMPTMALDDQKAYAELTTRRLITGLRHRHYPAIGFMIGDQLEDGRDAWGRAILNRWLDAGFQLGNHTYSHESFNKTPVADYIADVAHDDEILRPLLARRHQVPLWFRHPYLETGATLADKHQFEAWLADHGYKVAPVTMENSDWLFSPVYDDAIRRHDRAAQARVRKAYLDYTAKVVPWYREAGLKLFGRRPAYVFLLHACRLNADTMGDFAKILRANDLTPVSIDKAMADPIYMTPDELADAEGDEWLTRWAHDLHKDLPWDDFPDPPADIAAESEKLDPS